MSDTERGTPTERLENEIERLNHKVLMMGRTLKELHEGACRYHCRTAKANYMAGFEGGRYGHVTSQEAWHEHRASS